MEGAQVDQGEIICPEDFFSCGQLPGLLEDHTMSIGRSGGEPPEFLIRTNLRDGKKNSMASRVILPYRCPGSLCRQKILPRSF